MLLKCETYLKYKWRWYQSSKEIILSGAVTFQKSEIIFSLNSEWIWQICMQFHYFPSWNLCGPGFECHSDPSWHVDWGFRPYLITSVSPTILLWGFPPTSKTEHSFFVFSSQISSSLQTTVLNMLLRNP